MSARRVGDLTVEELREIVASATEEGVKRARRPPVREARAPASAANVARVSAILRRKGRLRGQGGAP